MAEIRRAEAVWSGNLQSGSGTVSAATTSLFRDLPVTWASRTEAPGGKTSPEELLAAAHAACFSMAFSSDLAKRGYTAERLEVAAAVTFAKQNGGWGVAASALTVKGRVPGVSSDEFREVADKAKDGCPISRALKGNVELSVEATLES